MVEILTKESLGRWAGGERHVRPTVVQEIATLSRLNVMSSGKGRGMSEARALLEITAVMGVSSFLDRN